MTDTDVGAYAKVTLTVEVSVSSSWGPGCSIEQVHEQAASEARGKITQLLDRGRDGERHSIRLVGEARVDAIVAQRKIR